MPSEHILEQTQTSAITSTAEIWMSFHYCHPIFETEVFLAKTTWSMQDVTHTQWVLDVKERKSWSMSPLVILRKLNLTRIRIFIPAIF